MRHEWQRYAISESYRGLPPLRMLTMDTYRHLGRMLRASASRGKRSKEPDRKGAMTERPPALRNDKDHDSAIETMRNWFLERFESPSQRTPINGGYVWIYGGPFDAFEQLSGEFGATYPEAWIAELVNELQSEAFEWTHTPSFDEPNQEKATGGFADSAELEEADSALPSAPSAGGYRVLTGHEAPVNGCALTPDAEWALSASEDATLRLWDLQGSAEPRVLTFHEDPVYGCALTPDGSWALSAHRNGTLRLWDLQGDAEPRVLTGHDDEVNACALAADGRLALSASEDATLRVWDLQGDAEPRVLRGHEGPVLGCALPADGRWALSASSDGTSRLWDLQGSAEPRVLAAHAAGVGGCALTPDGRWVLSASDGTLRLWDLQGPNVVEPSGDRSLAVAAHSDLPLNCDAIDANDHLGFSTYAAALFQLVTHKDTSLPLSIAVSAPWGSGKTSILRWVQCELDRHRDPTPHMCRVVPTEKSWQQHENGGDVEPAVLEARGRGLTRSFKTVWIDAWRFEENAALWAAFTKEIYRQGQATMQSRWERLRFRLALAEGAGSVAELGSWWKVIFGRLLFNRGSRLPSVAATAVLAVVGFLVSRLFGGEVGEVVGATLGAGGLGGLAATLGWAKGVIRQPFSFDLDKVTAAAAHDPVRVDHITAPEDVGRLVRLLAPGDEDGLAVFIDDLDRCTPDKVKDAVEAINLLFGAASAPTGTAAVPNIVFILGMDAEVVATSIRVAYAPTVRELRRRDPMAAEEFGHRFLDKIVQLSFDIPDPDKEDLATYMDGLLGLGGDSQGADAGVAEDETQARNLRDSVRRAAGMAQSASLAAEAVEKIVSGTPDRFRLAVREFAAEEIQRTNLSSIGKDSAEVREAIVTAARLLPPRPRDYKRFLNAVRLQVLVANRLRPPSAGRKRATAAQIAKWTALTMRWPTLATEVRRAPSLLGELERWARGGAPMPTVPRRIEGLFEDGMFKESLGGEPEIGSADLHGMLAVH